MGKIESRRRARELSSTARRRGSEAEAAEIRRGVSSPFRPWGDGLEVERGQRFRE